jgi:hypothetical protein
VGWRSFKKNVFISVHGRIGMGDVEEKPTLHVCDDLNWWDVEKRKS